MTINLILLLLFGLFTKHLVIDFMLQTPYQYLNKGTFGHPGGVLHSGLHAIGTCLVLVVLIPDAIFVSSLVIALSMMDMVIHYITDYSKVNICKHFKWTATTSEYFWWATGIDQYIHCLTYLLIVFLL